MQLQVLLQPQSPATAASGGCLTAASAGFSTTSPTFSSAEQKQQQNTIVTIFPSISPNVKDHDVKTFYFF